MPHVQRPQFALQHESQRPAFAKWMDKQFGAMKVVSGSSFECIMSFESAMVCYLPFVRVG
jgi:hypothetical protein